MSRAAISLGRRPIVLARVRRKGTARRRSGPPAEPSRTVEGTISRIVPAGSRTIKQSPLTHLGGGDIAVDPATGEAREPYFELTIDPPADPAAAIGHGMTGPVLLGGKSETVGKTIYRRLARFTNKLMQD